MLEAFSPQEWTLMKFEDVRKALEDEAQDHIVCPMHKTAEVTRSAQKAKSNTYKGRSSQDSDLE